MSPKWKALEGSLLNLSYGYGKVFVVPHEKLEGQVQGGMCELPIPQFPTGVMRGRFHPVDGQLYLCGMFAWAGNQTTPGGFYRLRATGQPSHLPLQIQVDESGIELKFSDPVERNAAEQPDNYQIKVWSLKRTANYGSQHYDEKSLEITKATLAKDNQTVRLEVRDLAPTWCMEIKYDLIGTDGSAIHRVIHNTIHKLGTSK
jgi:hypothetical protein